MEMSENVNNIKRIIEMFGGRVNTFSEEDSRFADIEHGMRNKIIRIHLTTSNDFLFIVHIFAAVILIIPKVA